MTEETFQAILTLFGNVMVALITGGLAFYGVKKTAAANHDAVINEIKATQREQAVEMRTQIASVKEDIIRLEKKQEKHNQVIERTYKLEQQVSDMAAQLARANAQ